MKEILSRAFALWLPLIAVLTGMMLFGYWGLQQQYRIESNDPQIQMAEDAAARLAGGESAPALIGGTPPIAIDGSIAPWLAIYDATGVPLASSGVIDNVPPHLPQGIFDTSTWKLKYAEWGIGMAIPPSETRFSWQPRAGVRQAVVVVRTDKGDFVASGRSLRETENRISVLTEGAALIWGGTALGSLLLIVTLIFFGWL